MSNHITSRCYVVGALHVRTTVILFMSMSSICAIINKLNRPIQTGGKSRFGVLGVDLISNNSNCKWTKIFL